jgi:hypothetical protein
LIATTAFLEFYYHTNLKATVAISFESHHTIKVPMKESLLHKLTKEQPERNTTCWRNIFILAIGMIQKETVCLNKIKGAVGAITGNTTTKPVSHYKRLIRIFDS